MKQISEALEPEREKLKEAISDLYYSIFPADIFIIQHFFDVWISVHPQWVIRFSNDLESIEMMNDVES